MPILQNPKAQMALMLALVMGLAFLPKPGLYSSRNKATLLPTEKKIQENIPEFAQKGIEYLVEVQFENGGWGAGTHANQGMIDATRVQVDPATTAFAAMALLRAGNTLHDGPHQDNLRRALLYLVELVEKSPEEALSISEAQGTQPQVKLGQNIDASMCVQFFIRIMPHAEKDPKLKNRISAAIDKCLHKIQKSQSEDGSITGGGWAPVLQSAMANNAMEMAQDQGFKIDEKKLKKSQEYQRDNVATSGDVRTERGAGVALYSVASTQRSTAKQARRAQDLVEKARQDGVLAPNAPVDAENLRKLNLSEEEAKTLSEAYRQNEITLGQMQDDQILSGFGNNGGEEFLSFMMTSESLVITGGEAWEKWQAKMYNLLQSIQNQDGSWNGHHCITSPVFCTAACILALTAENDRELLQAEQNKK